MKAKNDCVLIHQARFGCLWTCIFVVSVAAQEPGEFSAVTWSVPVTVRLDGVMSQEALTFGTKAGATIGLDTGIDVLNPPPPPNTFDAYFLIAHPLFPQLSEDYRSLNDSTITWSLGIATTSGRAGTIRWNAAAFPVGNPARAVLQIRQGANVLANMLTVDSLRFIGDQSLQIVCFSTAKTGVGSPSQENWPSSFSLQAYPNPFSEHTTLAITVVKASLISVSIMNVLGQEIRAFTHYSAKPGLVAISWDGIDRHGRGAAPGIYFCKVTVGEKFSLRKLYRK